MRKLCAILLAVILLLSLAGCGGMSDVKAEPEEEKVEAEKTKEEPAKEPMEQPQEPPEPIKNKVETDYFTLTPPENWDDSCIWRMEGNGLCTLRCIDEANKDTVGGLLFSLCFYPMGEVYDYLPAYEALGTVEVEGLGIYVVVAVYPSDVQYGPGGEESYQKHWELIPEVLSSLEFKEGCTFTPGATEEPFENGTTFDTLRFYISYPDSWFDDCVLDVSKSIFNKDDYFAVYDSANYGSPEGGLLFSVVIYPKGEDYTNLPSYEVVGSYVWDDIGSGDIVVSYPTDVQFSQSTADHYHKVQEQIPLVLKTITPHN